MVEERALETTRSLNLLAGYETPVVADASKLSAVSRSVRAQVLAGVREIGPPSADKHSPQEAGSMLLGFSSGPYQSSSGSAVSFARSAIAWPALGSTPGCIADRVPSHFAELLEGRRGGLVRAMKEVRSIRRRDGLPNMHGDATLNENRADYIWFVKEGVKRGIFRIGRKAKEHCRAFFVKKKDGNLRVIFDCRRANQHFAAPPGVNLFSAASFSEFVVEEDTKVYYGSCDVKNAFYQHALPGWLSNYFSLAGVRAYEVGVKHLDGVEVDPNTLLYPQLRVVPMGWSWGVALVQEAHLHLLSGVGGLTRDRQAVDFRPPPGLGPSPAFSMYIDNLCVVGVSKESVDQVLDRGLAAWQKAGLAVHEIEPAALTAKCLGGDQQGAPPSNGLSSRKVDQIYDGVGWLLRERCKCTSAEMGHLVGHLTFASLFKRESLSVFRSVYDFIGKDYTVPTELWVSVRRELEMMRHAANVAATN